MHVARMIESMHSERQDVDVMPIATVVILLCAGGIASNERFLLSTSKISGSLSSRCYWQLRAELKT